LTCLAILLAFPPAASAVLPANPLQEQVDEADPGDTILVNPGTYEGYLNLDKEVTIEAKSDGVVLVAPEDGDLMWISGSGVVLKGLVLDGGVSRLTAIGVGSVSGLEVRNCTFRNLQTGMWISSDAMNVVVANNTFENVIDYGIDNETDDNTNPYFRCLAIGNRFTFGPEAHPDTKAIYAKSRKGTIALFNTFEDYDGHNAIYTPDVADGYQVNATGNYWGEDADESDIDAVCSGPVLFVPWSFADGAGHTDFQLVEPNGGPFVFDVGISEGITLSIEQITTTLSTYFPLALAAYGDESPCPTTVQEDNPGADSYTAYFILQDVKPALSTADDPPYFRLTAEFPKEAIGEDADLNDLRVYIYEESSWVDVTEADWLTIDVEGDTARLIIEKFEDPGPIAITAGNGDSSSSSGCSSTGAASLGLLLLAPFGLFLRSKK
jgi:Synergist-CTERM protein sorting domain-containing protein